jgi:HEPN domain-containing protein
MSMPPEAARVLLDKAKGDWRMLQTLERDGETPVWGIGFHAQQAVEKAIKAVLCAVGVSFPRTHNIGYLLDLLAAAGHALPPDAPLLPELTVFGSFTRYGDPAGADPPEEDLDRPWALAAVRRTLEWTCQVLNMPRDRD